MAWRCWGEGDSGAGAHELRSDRAAMQGKEVPGQISVLYQHLMPGLRDAHGDVPQAVKTNACFRRSCCERARR